MSKTKNSVLIQQVFDALFKVIGRRTLDSFAVQILKSTVDKLEKKYDILTLVTIHDDFFSEGTQTTFDPQFDTLDSSQLGDALNALLRVIYMELIGTTPLQKKGPEPPRYTWDTVATWKYNNNTCLLYDEQGRLLDTLQLDLLIEDYVERVTESQKQSQLVSPQTTMMKVTEKEHELLTILQRRDIDLQSAVTLLHTSRQKFDAMVKKLLQLEMLQYQTENEVKLTEKGLQYLTNVTKK
jgi:hypothetical protein